MSNVRLSHTSYVVLGLLDQLGTASPYDLKRAAAAGVGHFWSLPHTQLYSEPARLAEAGYLSERRETEGRRRRLYTLTARGRKALDEWRATPTNELYEIRDAGRRGALEVVRARHPELIDEAEHHVGDL